MTDPQWKNDLIQWMEQVRQAYLATTRSKGYGDQVNVQKWMASRNDKNGFSFKRETVTKNVLSLGAEYSILSDIDLSSCPFPTDLAVKFLDKYGANSKHWLPFHQHDAKQLLQHPDELSFEDRPEDWLIAAIFFPIADQYARTAKQGMAADTDCANELIQEAVDLCVNGTITHEYRFPISGIELDDGAAYEGLSIKPMTPEEIGSFMEARGRFNILHNQATGGFDIFTPTHELIVTTETKKHKQAFSWINPDTALLAFHLNGIAVGSSGRCLTRQKPYWTEFSQGSQFTITTHDDDQTHKITFAELQQVWRTIVAIDGPARDVDPADFHKAREAPHIAVHQFLRGIDDAQAIDSVLNFVIGLESIFLTGESKTELKYKFCLNGANWLTENRAIRHEIHDQLKGLYDLRSAIVHGSLSDKQKLSIGEQTKLARDLLKRAVLKGLTKGWPEKGDFLKLALM